jgi:hypothetical protein
MQYFLRGYSLVVIICLDKYMIDKYDNIREMYYIFAGFFQNWNFSL